jgi:hypothetical protein
VRAAGLDPIGAYTMTACIKVDSQRRVAEIKCIEMRQVEAEEDAEEA